MQEIDFKTAIDESAYTVAGASRAFEIPYANLNNWYKGKPTRKCNKPILEKLMFELSKKKRIERHPSYGYATPEQIEKLKGYVTEIERESIMKQIEKQTKLRGKID